MHTDIWACPEAANYVPGTDLTGYKVEATDGTVGKVDKHSAEVGACYLVVDTGPWIFGKQVLLPAGIITSVDSEQRLVHVSRAKEEIKNAPEYVPDKHDHDGGHRMEFADYYLAFFR
ncbi:PRC-barrel domain containing protein [Streptomyces sp. TRM76323]|uniref:PRC-barrel domain containing protein n=1 Tax=Streptomyces tamarix TaxID=3078565 RepID=A0ABU3QR40_9ACTN|nr:PRC-barrel domain containing protein [Streptomyces tamarix]MDT9685229.1 PRC-barrel domain containing protein [Streptomyces tamarix]